MENETAPNPEQVSFLEELYVARCKDTLEQPSREEFMRFSSRLKAKVAGSVVNLRNQHLGVSAANTLSKFFRNKNDLIKLDLYCNLIRDHGFQVVTHFVQLNKFIRVFNIGCNDLTDKSAPQLAGVVSANHVRSLQVGSIDKSLHPNKLSSITVDALSEAIVKSDSLYCLGLNGSSLGSKIAPTAPPPAEGLIRMLSKSTSLLNLSVANCQINSDDMMRIIENGFCFNCTLKRLDISGNNLSTNVGIRFGQYLMEHTKEMVVQPDAENPETDYDIVTTTNTPHIFYLDASSNAFSPQVATVFSQVLNTYPYLGYLDLSFNQIGDEGAIELAQALSNNQTIVELHIAGNGITPEGGIAIANALAVNQTITHLNVAKNKLGDETAQAIAMALLQNKSITTLNISSSMLSNTGGIMIAQATQRCHSLIVLDMSDNFFTEDAGGAMEKTFRENGTILKINVSGTQINHFSFHALNEICQRNAALLKQKEQKPLRNQYVKSQYSVVELQRKEAILKQLLEQKENLQGQIDELNETIKALKEEEDMKSKDLTKQIQEKEQQMETEAATFQEKKEKLEEEFKELTTKKEELQKALDGQLVQNQEVRAKIEDRKAVLKKMQDEFDAEKAAKLEEIENIQKQADELMKLARDPEALAALEKLPDFLVFEEEPDEQPQLIPMEPTEPPPASSKKSRKSSKKKSKKSVKK